MSLVLGAGGIFFAVGIVVGLIGMGIMGAAFPIYQKTLNKERKAIAPQIIALSKEIENEA